MVHVAGVHQVFVLERRVGPFQDADRVGRGGLVEDRLLEVQHHLEAGIHHRDHAGIRADLRYVHAACRQGRHQRRVIHVDDGSHAILAPEPHALAIGGLHPVGPVGGVTIRENHDAERVHVEHGPEHPVPAARHRALAVVQHQEDDLPAGIHPFEGVGVRSTAEHDDGTTDLLRRRCAKEEPRVGAEIGVDVLAAGHESDMRFSRVELGLDDLITLEPGAILTARLEAKRLELVGDVLRRHFEPGTRCVAAHHRVVCNDVDPLGHVRGRDGRSRLLHRGTGRWDDGGWGLGGKGGGGEEGEGEQVSHA